MDLSVARLKDLFHDLCSHQQVIVCGAEHFYDLSFMSSSLIFSHFTTFSEILQKFFINPTDFYYFISVS